MKNSRRSVFAVSLWTTFLLSSAVFAEPAPAVNEVPPAAVKSSSEPAPVWQTGETKESPTPAPITERQGSGVFVTLTRTALSSQDLSTNTEVTTPETFHRFDAQNAGDAVRRMTSVAIDEQGHLGTLRLAGIRGGTSNQTLVLLDGRPLGGASLSSSQDLSEIPVEQIDHIEVVRGGVSALYGPNALGGVINIISKRATYEGTPISHVGFEKRSFGNQSYRLDFGSRMGRLDYFFFGDQQRESGFRDNSDAKTYNVGGNFGLSMGAGGKLLFDIGSYHSNAGVSGQLSPAIPTNQFDNKLEKQAGTPDARQVTESRYARASYLLPLPANTLATVRAFGSQRQVEFEIPSFFVNVDRHEQTKGAEAQVDLPLGFLVGGNFIHDRLDSRDLVTPANNYVASVENYGIFAQDTLRWKRLTVIPSGRFDHNSVVGESKNPRVQTLVDATDWLRFSASAARSFRAPTIDDLLTPFTDFGGGFSFVGNPNLRPEKGWTYDGGFELHNDSSSVRISYFRANITDLIQTTPDLAATTINVGRARRQGMEVQAAQVFSRNFLHTLNYTYLENRGMPQGFTEFVTLRLSPKHTVNYITTWKPVERLALDNSFRFRDARWEGNDRTGTKLGAVFLWDLKATYQVRQLELYIGAENITGKRYEDRGGFPLPGRRYFGGVSLRLWG